jgi:hypothetical protein
MADKLSIPSQERGKLFPFVPETLWAIIFVTVITLGILLFDFEGGYSTNPVVFYSIPFIYSIIFLSQDEIPVLLSVLGAYFVTTREKVIALLSIPAGLGVGWLLVKLVTAQGSIIRISTYPWAVTSLYTAGFLSTFSTGTSFVLYLFVAIFEESASIIMGKTFANWFYNRNINGITSSFLGYFAGRFVLTLHHWFSYGGLQEPSLYFSAFFLFSIMTILGITFGVLGQGLKDKLSDYKVIPISILVMISAHFMFDFLLSQLMIIA